MECLGIMMIISHVSFLRSHGPFRLPTPSQAEAPALLKSELVQAPSASIPPSRTEVLEPKRTTDIVTPTTQGLDPSEG